MGSRQKQKLIYVLAASHSGSTMTSMLLGAHPELTCVGELKAIHLGDPDTYLCSCHQLAKECSFWNSISRRMSDYGVDFNILDAGTDIRSGANRFERRLLKPLVRGNFLEKIRDIGLQFSTGWRENYPEIQRRNVLLVKSILEETGAEAIVDSSKIGLRLKYLLRNPEFDVKVVWLVRDGRGVSLAYLNPSEYADAKENKNRGGGTGKSIEPSRDIRTGSREWRRSNEEAAALVNMLNDDQWMRLRYEDLCTDPQTSLASIFEFVGVDPKITITDYKTKDHHVIGNGMRLDSDSEILLDDRWRTTLDTQQLRAFEEVAGEMNRSFGFPPS